MGMAQGSCLLFFTDYRCSGTVWGGGAWNLLWDGFLVFPSSARKCRKVLGAQGGHLGKLGSIWQGFSKSRCRFTVGVPPKLTGICRESFPILYQLKIKSEASAVVLGMS